MSPVHIHPVRVRAPGRADRAPRHGRGVHRGETGAADSPAYHRGTEGNEPAHPTTVERTAAGDKCGETTPGGNARAGRHETGSTHEKVGHGREKIHDDLGGGRRDEGRGRPADRDPEHAHVPALSGSREERGGSPRVAAERLSRRPEEAAGLVLDVGIPVRQGTPSPPGR